MPFKDSSTEGRFNFPQEWHLHTDAKKRTDMNASKDKALQMILDYADKAHGEQVRKYIPRPYIKHPFKVMKRCSRFTSEFSVLAAALLHDVLEDTEVSRDEMFAFLQTVTNNHTAEKILNIVVELTDIYTVENFPHLDRKTRKMMESARLEQISSEAQIIKYADIMDNTNEIVQCDPHFALTYMHECRMYLDKMVKGHFELYKLAVQKVVWRLEYCKGLCPGFICDAAPLQTESINEGMALSV